MQYLDRLNDRNRVSYKAIDRLSKHDPHGATPLHVAAELFPREVRTLDEIQAFVEALPNSIKQLQPDDTEALRELAARLENGKRRGNALTVLVQKIVRSPSNKVALEKPHAKLLGELLKTALAEDVQTRVHDLRAKLKELGPDEDGLILTVSRAPYRFVRVPCTLDEKDARAVEAFYMMFDRQAWRAQPSDIETKAFRVAQLRLRYALCTGVIYADDGEPIRWLRGTPKSHLSDELRDKLDWVSEVSSMLQGIFDNFYVPCSGSTHPGRFHVLARWARPHAPEIVHFILAARNEILRVMNPLFQSIERRPYPLVEGHDFPPHWVPPGSIPAGAPVMSRQELHRKYRRLREIGVNHMYPERAA